MSNYYLKTPKSQSEIFHITYFTINIILMTLNINSYRWIKVDVYIMNFYSLKIVYIQWKRKSITKPF